MSFSQDIRTIMEKIEALEADSVSFQVDDPLDHPKEPSRRHKDPGEHIKGSKKSHVVKKTKERYGDEAVDNIDKVVSYVDNIEDMDQVTRSRLILKAEEIVQKLS